MARYRKLPVIIRAEQFNPPHGIPDGVEFPVPQEYQDGLAAVGEKFDLEKTGVVRTLEGPFVCWPGDFIITGIKGERYPCKPDIFAGTYELVSDSE